MMIQRKLRRRTDRASRIFTVFPAMMILTLSASCLLATTSARAQSTDPAVVGKWSEVQDWPVRAIHMNLLPTGKVMFWTRHPEGFPPYLWDPDTSALAGALPTAGWQEFCASHVLLADGQMLLTGGHLTADGHGAPHAALYNSFTNTWTRQPDMNNGRWYPSSVLLGNGDVVVLSGSYNTSYANNMMPQVFSNGVWRNLTGAQRFQELYPYLHLAPNGKVFLSGPVQSTYYLDTAGNGSWIYVGERKFPNRDYGCSVMYGDGKVFFAGGGDPPTETAEVIDLNAPVPTWRYVGSLSKQRRQINATLLPDGKILVTGGVSGPGWNDMTTPVLSSEVWDPVTEKFTTWASMAVGRWYHSTVVLLPDGRLLSAGGDNNLNAEIFSPPYLFQGPRPVITSAPGLVRYGATFDVETPDASKVTNANWIRLSSVTHARNFDQRINRLSFQATATGLRVTAPSDPNLCPPGYYMLFLLNEKGVPSVARIQRIGDGVLTVTPPTNLTAVPGAGQVSLNWSASPEALAYTIKRGTRKGGPYSTTVARGVTTTSYTDTGLANDKTYHYVVIATNGNLESVPSSPVSAKPRTLPAAPTGLTATATSGTRIALSWVDNATNEQGFYIERSTDGVTFAQIARVGPNARTYGNGGLPRKTRYSYRVRAYNATGPSGYSDIASATTN